MVRGVVGDSAQTLRTSKGKRGGGNKVFGH